MKKAWPQPSIRREEELESYLSLLYRPVARLAEGGEDGGEEKKQVKKKKPVA
jgi:hypothetical protein